MGFIIRNVFRIFVACLLWAVFIEPGQLKFKEYPVFIKDWPQELSGFSIAFITDAHVGSPHIDMEKLQEIVSKTNALNPDLTLLGGDYVIQGVIGGTPVPSKNIIDVLAQLRAKNGVYGVLGNHDWADDGKRMYGEFQAARVPILEDAAQHFQIGNRGFWLVGISDYNSSAHNLHKAFSGVTNNDPVIAFTHSPDIFPEVPTRVGLTIAGHTHGGQVYIPFIGRPVIPSKYGERYAQGLVQENNHQIFIGSGIGTSILPIRFLTPPEVSILKIYPATR